MAILSTGHFGVVCLFEGFYRLLAKIAKRPKMAACGWNWLFFYLEIYRLIVFSICIYCLFFVDF